MMNPIPPSIDGKMNIGLVPLRRFSLHSAQFLLLLLCAFTIFHAFSFAVFILPLESFAVFLLLPSVSLADGLAVLVLDFLVVVPLALPSEGLALLTLAFALLGVITTQEGPSSPPEGPSSLSRPFGKQRQAKTSKGQRGLSASGWQNTVVLSANQRYLTTLSFLKGLLH